jgi:hypothetical protein
VVAVTWGISVTCDEWQAVMNRDRIRSRAIATIWIDLSVFIFPPVAVCKKIISLEETLYINFYLYIFYLPVIQNAVEKGTMVGNEEKDLLSSRNLFSL